MPTGFVQKNTVSNGSAASVAFPGAVTAGNTLFGCVRIGNTVANEGAGSVLSDTVNGNWTPITSFPLDDGIGNSLWAYFFQNTGSGTPTVSFVPTNDVGSCRIFIGEVATSVITGVIDQANCQTFNHVADNFARTPVIATANANDLLVAFFEGNAGSTGPVVDNSSGSNPTNFFNEADISTEKLYVSSAAVSATGSYNEIFDLGAGGGDDGVAAIVAIKTSTGGGGGDTLQVPSRILWI